MLYEITGITGKKPYKDHFGDKIGYTVGFTSDDGVGVAQLSKVPESPAPFVGEKIWGHLEAFGDGWKLKKDKTPDGMDLTALNPSQKALQASQSPVSTPNVDWDKKEDKIAWQNAQNVAAQLFQQQGSAGVDGLRIVRDTLYDDYRKNFYGSDATVEFGKDLEF